MSDRKRKSRGGRGRKAVNDTHELRLVKQDIAMLDMVLKASGSMRSEYDDRWIEGCREGMAIAYDVISGNIKDIAIRRGFEGKPIRVRYYEGAKRTVSDESLYPYEGQTAQKGKTEEDDGK